MRRFARGRRLRQDRLGAIVSQVRTSTAASWADFEGDGDLDLFVGGAGGGANQFFINNGDGTFAPGEFPDAGRTWGVAFGDYDDDNDLDFFCANWNLVNYLYRNDGPAGFARITTGPVVTGVAKSLGGSWGDYDGDQDLDLLVSGGGNVTVGTNVIYRNDGAGVFRRVTTGEFVTRPGRYEGLSCADVDDDGDLDVFLSSYGGDNQLYRNDGGGGSWLGLSLHGTASNASAVGARVIVRAMIGGAVRRQVREKTSQTGHIAQSDRRLHFGLGDAAAVDSLTIRWPSGRVESYMDVPVNRYLSFTEHEPD